ncbi:MAG: hypothetical protein Q8K26_04295, partial [Candidatus Gracilibacteria bacterium]|nr:hypothetical protein [Candidatus Gracilibacteria bacterium]
AGNIKAKVTAIEGDNVTVEIDNTGNPFYGKKLAVGLTGEFEGNSVVIKKLTDKEVTIEVNNKANPFYGKKIEVGMEGKSGENTIKIVSITKENVTIAAGRHELAGKTLTFDIEIKSIK